MILALAIALLLGFICEIVAPETDSRNWISLFVGFISIASVIIPAMGLKYANEKRGVSIKVLSWIMAFAISATNFFFSCFVYKIELYVVVVLLLAVIAWATIYGMFRSKE